MVKNAVAKWIKIAHPNHLLCFFVFLYLNSSFCLARLILDRALDIDVASLNDRQNLRKWNSNSDKIKLKINCVYLQPEVVHIPEWQYRSIKNLSSPTTTCSARLLARSVSVSDQQCLSFAQREWPREIFRFSDCFGSKNRYLTSSLYIFNRSITVLIKCWTDWSYSESTVRCVYVFGDLCLELSIVCV